MFLTPHLTIALLKLNIINKTTYILLLKVIKIILIIILLKLLDLHYLKKVNITLIRRNTQYYIIIKK